MAQASKGCPVPKGTLLIIGGKESKGGEDPQNHEKPPGYDPMEVLKTFVELIENKENGIEVITTGSTEGESVFEEYKKFFRTRNYCY